MNGTAYRPITAKPTMRNIRMSQTRATNKARLDSSNLYRNRMGQWCFDMRDSGLTDATKMITLPAGTTEEEAEFFRLGSIARRSAEYYLGALGCSQARVKNGAASAAQAVLQGLTIEDALDSILTQQERDGTG
jgi:hypothetical protein